MNAPKGAGGGHTPGPWFFRARPDDMMLEVVGPWQGHTRAIVAEVERDRDARLIAAAPDQHKTLLGVEEWIVNHVPDCEGREWHLRAVRAALAKAGGES